MINANYNNSPVRTIEAQVELLSRSSPDAEIIKHTEDLVEIEISRAGAGRFFGFGVCHKANLKLRDLYRSRSVSTDNYCYISFNGVSAFPPMYVTEVNRNEKNNQLSITLYDALEAAEQRFTSEIELSSYTLKEFVEACAEALGLAGVETYDLEEFELFYEEGANLEGTESFREIFDAAADATQTIYFINADNVLTFKRLEESAAADFPITKEEYFELKCKTNRRLTGICSATELGDNLEALLEQSGTTHYIKNNAFWDLREDRAQLVEKALEAMGGFTINQFECEWRGNYLLEPGDKLELTDKENGVFYSYLLNDTIKYDGAYEQKTEYEYEEDEESENNSTSLGDVIKLTYAKVDKANKQVDIIVGEVAANSNALSAIQMNTDSIVSSVEGLQTRQDDISEDIEKLTEKVSMQLTKEDVQIEILKELDNGVSKVETTTGFTFNEDGLTIAKSSSDITTTITEDGMTVKKGSSDVLTANNEGVKAVDLHATTYLIIGDNSRFEDYGSSRTACFWIGG